MAYTYEDYKKMYAEKKRTLQECLDLIVSGDHICFGKDCNEPLLFCQQLHTIAPRVEGVTVLKGRSSDFGFLQNEGMKGHILTQSAFFSKGWQRPLELGNCTFVPNDLRDQPFWYNAANPRNVYIAAVTPMDENGNFQVNLSQMWERDIDPLSCKKIILEVNKNLKTVNGGVDINIKDVDAFYEAEYPIYEIQDAPSSEIDNRIGQYVAELVHDGDTIQLGIGGIPDAAALALMDKHDLGVHSEMLTNSMVDLLEAGVITGRKKSYMQGKMVGTFAYGTQRLYDTLNENPSVLMLRGETVNNPQNVAKNDNFVSINSCLSVDLTGQVCSETIGSRQYSGSGGQADMAVGAAHAKNGRNIIATASTKRGGTVSTISAQLEPGSIVTLSRNQIDYVVTEYGIAPLVGRSVRQRVENLIAVAHPDFRPELREQAKRLMLW